MTHLTRLASRCIAADAGDEQAAEVANSALVAETWLTKRRIMIADEIPRSLPKGRRLAQPFSNSPRMRSAPHSRFLVAISLIR